VNPTVDVKTFLRFFFILVTFLTFFYYPNVIYLKNVGRVQNGKQIRSTFKITATK